MTTFEEARRCPKCESPGADISQRRGPLGSKLHVIECRNGRCKWNNTTWVVQVHADGTIQEETEHDKIYPKIPDRTDAVQASMQNLLDQTLSGGETR